MYPFAPGNIETNFWMSERHCAGAKLNGQDDSKVQPGFVIYTFE